MEDYWFEEMADMHLQIASAVARCHYALWFPNRHLV